MASLSSVILKNSTKAGLFSHPCYHWKPSPVCLTDYHIHVILSESKSKICAGIGRMVKLVKETDFGDLFITVKFTFIHPHFTLISTHIIINGTISFTEEYRFLLNLGVINTGDRHRVSLLGTVRVMKATQRNLGLNVSNGKYYHLFAIWYFTYGWINLLSNLEGFTFDWQNDNKATVKTV